MTYLAEAAPRAVDDALAAHARSEAVTVARGAVGSCEVAECTCPEWCERDHDLD